MIRLLLFCLLFLTTLAANEITSFDTDEINESNQSSTISYYPQKVLYLSYDEIPSRVVKGEIFSVTLKTLSTIKQLSAHIEYELSNYEGIEPLTDIPYTIVENKYYYETFYFLATDSKIKLPDFTATLTTDEDILYRPQTILGEKVNVITLNPKKNFSNIIADSFELVEYKTTSFDNNHNILIFVAKASNCDIKVFNLNNVFKQGIESIEESFFDSKITYYAIINKDIENFSFSYFNLKKNKFILIDIPIIVNDDSVTTQSDLKPKDQSRERLKMTIAAAVALFFFLFIIWRRKYIYLIFIIIPLAYIAYLSIPSKDLCIKKGAKIRLLPVENGTIFETTQTQIFLKKEGSVKDFVKVKLKNEKIGWVINEDICSN